MPAAKHQMKKVEPFRIYWGVIDILSVEKGIIESFSNPKSSKVEKSIEWLTQNCSNSD